MQNQFQQLSRPARRASAPHITGTGIAQPAVKVETGPVLQGKSMPNAHGKVVQRFGVHVKAGGNLDMRNVPIDDIKFLGRPPGAFLGGTSSGATRHVVGVQLENAAIKSLFVGKTIGAVANQLKQPPTVEGVEAGIKEYLVGFKDQRSYYQGSKEGNDKLEVVAQQGFSLMGKSRTPDGHIIDPDGFREGVKLAYLGTLDIPPQNVRQGNQAQLVNSIKLHRQLFKIAYHVDDAFLPSGEEALNLLNASGDELSGFAHSRVQALKSGAPVQDAHLFGHFTVSPQPQQQHLSLGGGGQSPYGLGPSHGGYPQQQHLSLPYQPPGQTGGGQLSFLSGHTPNPSFTAPPILFGGGQPGPFVPQHTTTSTYQQQPPPFLLPPPTQQQSPGGTPSASARGFRIQDLLNK